MYPSLPNGYNIYEGLTIEKAVSLVINYETTLNQKKDEVPEEILEIKRRNENNKRIDCCRCGFKHLRMKCSAMGKTCFNCNGKNHFESVCTKKKVNQVENRDSDDEQIEELNHEFV